MTDKPLPQGIAPKSWEKTQEDINTLAITIIDGVSTMITGILTEHDAARDLSSQEIGTATHKALVNILATFLAESTTPEMKQVVINETVTMLRKDMGSKIILPDEGSC